VVPESKQESKNTEIYTHSNPLLKKGENCVNPLIYDPTDKPKPTQKGVHIIQDNNLPKKLGERRSALFLNPSNIDPYTIIRDIPYDTKIVNNISILSFLIYLL